MWKCSKTTDQTRLPNFHIFHFHYLSFSHHLSIHYHFSVIYFIYSQSPLVFLHPIMYISSSTNLFIFFFFHITNYSLSLPFFPSPPFLLFLPVRNSYLWCWLWMQHLLLQPSYGHQMPSSNAIQQNVSPSQCQLLPKNQVLQRVECWPKPMQQSVSSCYPLLHHQQLLPQELLDTWMEPTLWTCIPTSLHLHYSYLWMWCCSCRYQLNSIGL